MLLSNFIYRYIYTYNTYSTKSIDMNYIFQSSTLNLEFR